MTVHFLKVCLGGEIQKATSKSLIPGMISLEDCSPLVGALLQFQKVQCIQNIQ